MKKLELPKDKNGKLYWIPVVVKHKDYLMGYIDSFRVLSTLYDIPLNDLNKTLSSDRFNDILQDGSRVRDLSKEQLKEKMKSIILQPSREEHIENDTSLYEDNLLTIDCPHCGMFYSYEETEDIPDKTTKCVTCGKIILLYTDIDDSEIVYEGKPDMIEEVVKDIHNDFFRGEDE